MVLSGHTHCVTCVKWGGEGLLYTASQDRTIKVWRAKDVSHCSWSVDHLVVMATPTSVSHSGTELEEAYKKWEGAEIHSPNIN